MARLLRRIGTLAFFAGINLFLYESLPPVVSGGVFHAMIRLAVLLISCGIALVGISWLARSLAKEKGPSAADEKLPAVMYGLASAAFVGEYAYVCLLDLRAGGRERMMAAFGHGLVDSFVAAGFTGDPVGNFLIYTVLVLIAIALLPGVIGSMLYFLGGLLALAFLAFGVQLLIELARMSLVGALVALVITVLPIVLFVRSKRAAIAKALWRIAGPIYGLFLDWWLTPLLRRRKEQRMIDELREKRRQCELIVVQLQAQDPQAVADLGPIAMQSDTWLERVIGRFHDRDRQKTMAERTKLIGLAKHYFGEYRAMLDAKDELSLADQDSRIRHMERDKKERVLKGELEELEDDAVGRKELRALDRTREKLTRQHEIDQLTRKISGGDDGPYRQAMNDKRARRLVDIQDLLFESLEHPVSTDMEARLLYKQLQKRIDRHAELSDDEKDELLDRLERRWKQTFGKASSTPIFEEE
jgi:hypothetical protein